MQEEFERQVQNLVEKGYPDFSDVIEPLRKIVATLSETALNLDHGTLPFVLVVKESVLSIEEMMSKTRFNGKAGITKLFPHQSTDFSITKVEVPESEVYLLVDIDRGKETLNITPEEAYRIIESKDRSPLTLAEGVALITQFPEFLQRNNCFSMLGSRNPNDQRVPAIWINAKNEANLGWCWDRNPHTWLGSASCKKRLS